MSEHDENANPPADQTQASAPAAPPENPNAKIKELEVEGYKFTVDTDLIDDVEVLELIDRIENKRQIGAIVPMLDYIIGKDGYTNMKAYFVKKDGRFRASKLTQIYTTIMGAFDPKD